jgi:hypothetical protein
MEKLASTCDIRRCHLDPGLGICRVGEGVEDLMDENSGALEQSVGAGAGQSIECIDQGFPLEDLMKAA